MTATITDTRRKFNPLHHRKSTPLPGGGEAEHLSLTTQFKAKVTLAYMASSRAVRRALAGVLRFMRTRLFQKMVVFVGTMVGAVAVWSLMAALALLAFTVHPVFGYIALAWLVLAIVGSIAPLAESIEIRFAKIDLEVSNRELNAAINKLPGQRSK